MHLLLYSVPQARIHVYSRILRHLERKKRHSFPLQRYGGSFRSMICEQMLRMQIRFMTISCEIALMWMPGKKIEDNGYWFN